jgi:D-alanyl-D-alanine dipeptidase
LQSLDQFGEAQRSVEMKSRDQGLFLLVALVGGLTSSNSGLSGQSAAAFVQNTGAPSGESIFRIKPVRPIPEIRREALRSHPPAETGEFRKPDLVDVKSLDDGIRLDIRYATANNFMGVALYTSAKAFLQRPAAKALLQAQKELVREGFGIIIFDAYRPWYVTKMFWEATPEGQRRFVADPAKGSRHNRGCAVDVTLYDLKTLKPVAMCSGYDEFSERAHPDYEGGTAEQRRHRKTLRLAMERAGFSVYEYEWWHFDYKDWQKYPILNQTFEELGKHAATAR